uniref:Regulator of G-protein signaling 16 n=1 Tax=Nothoprocta perdicaria TaxID=30464 RepID=A0A8C7A0V4_NOTPE
MCRGWAALPGACLERCHGLNSQGEACSAVSHLAGFLASQEGDEHSFLLLPFCSITHFSLFFPGGVTAFHTFLKTEFSEENLDFWLACEDFKKTRSKTKLASKANRIFEEFVQSEAPREVNIDHETREITRKNLSGATSACFNEAQAKTRTLMEKDSYPRFLKSASYQDMTKQATSHCLSKRSHT